jgi:hypothetical protein
MNRPLEGLHNKNAGWNEIDMIAQMTEIMSLTWVIMT